MCLYPYRGVKQSGLYSENHPRFFFGGVRVAHLFSFAVELCCVFLLFVSSAQCELSILISLLGFL